MSAKGPIIDPALCRCCRAIKKCRVLTVEYAWQEQKEIYADMIMDCFGILLSHVDETERESGVCATCVVRLRDACAFRRQVLQCEELFLSAKLQDKEHEETKAHKPMEVELKLEPKDDPPWLPAPDHHDTLSAHYIPEQIEESKPPSRKRSPVASALAVALGPDGGSDWSASSSDSDRPLKPRKIQPKKKLKQKKVKEKKVKTANTKKALKLPKSNPSKR